MPIIPSKPLQKVKEELMTNLESKACSREIILRIKIPPIPNTILIHQQTLTATFIISLTFMTLGIYSLKFSETAIHLHTFSPVSNIYVYIISCMQMSMDVCRCLCMQMSMHVCRCLCMYVDVYGCVQTFMYVGNLCRCLCMQVSMYVDVYVCMQMSMYVCRCLCMYVVVYVCMQMSMYVCRYSMQVSMCE